MRPEPVGRGCPIRPRHYEGDVPKPGFLKRLGVETAIAICGISNEDAIADASAKHHEMAVAAQVHRNDGGPEIDELLEAQIAVASAGEPARLDEALQIEQRKSPAHLYAQRVRTAK